MVKQNKHAKPIIFGNCKEVLQTAMMLYFASNIVLGEEESEFCKKGWSELVRDVKTWKTSCSKEKLAKMWPCCDPIENYL